MFTEAVAQLAQGLLVGAMGGVIASLFQYFWLPTRGRQPFRSVFFAYVCMGAIAAAVAGVIAAFVAPDGSLRNMPWRAIGAGIAVFVPTFVVSYALGRVLFPASFAQIEQVFQRGCGGDVPPRAAILRCVLFVCFMALIGGSLVGAFAAKGSGSLNWASAGWMSTFLIGGQFTDRDAKHGGQ